MPDMLAHLTRQAAFSRATFGPGPRTKGVIDHIEEEFDEIADAETPAERAKEWTDVAILALDGLLRACRVELEAEGRTNVTHDEVAQRAVHRIVAKQGVNEIRDYPDWRTMSENQRINHIRSEFPPVTAPVHRATDLHPPVEGDEDRAG